MRRQRSRLRDLIHLPLDLDGAPPDPAALFSIDGFDDLPKPLRDTLNYGNNDMVLGSKQTPEPPCRVLTKLLARHSIDKVRAVLIDVLNDTSSLDVARQNRQRS